MGHGPAGGDFLPRHNAVIPLLLLGMAGFAWPQSQPDIVSLEGPRSLDIDINGDGIGDVVFANYSAKGNVHSYFSYSINIRDRTKSDLLHSVHIYPDGYKEGAGSSRLLDRSRSPECISRTHFLVRDDDGGSYELLTAEKLNGLFPPRPGTVEFTFHRLRALETVGPTWYIYEGYRKVKSRKEYCDVVEAATEEVFSVPSGPASEPADDKEQPPP